MKLNPSKLRKQIISNIDNSVNLFYIKIMNNNKLSNILDFSNESIDIGMYVKSIDIPDITYDENSQKRFGITHKYASNYEIGSCNINTYLDKNNKIYDFWMKWMQMIRNSENKRLFPDEYKYDIEVYKLNRINLTESMVIKLNGCWPSNINDFNFSHESESDLNNLNIEVKVDSLEYSIKNTITDKIEEEITKSLMDTIKNNWNKTLKKVTETEVDFDKIKDKYSKKTKETVKDITKDYLTKTEKTIKTRLKITAEKVKDELIAKVKNEINDLLPSYLRNLNYSSVNGLVNSLYDKAEGFLIKELRELESDINTSTNIYGLDNIKDKRVDMFEGMIKTNNKIEPMMTPNINTLDVIKDERVDMFEGMTKYEDSNVDEEFINSIKENYKKIIKINGLLNK